MLELNNLITESLPDYFEISFKSFEYDGINKVLVTIDDQVQLGNEIDDNSYNEDFYRYHDIFHYSFAAFLNWSPCTRALMKRKRKSNPLLDRIEDGAKAIITEEAISLIIFNEAKRNNFFESIDISPSILQTIKEMTSDFEVKSITEEEWKKTIKTSYSLFRELIENKGGKVAFDRIRKSAKYLG